MIRKKVKCIDEYEHKNLNKTTIIPLDTIMNIGGYLLDGSIILEHKDCSSFIVFEIKDFIEHFDVLKE